MNHVGDVLKKMMASEEKFRFEFQLLGHLAPGIKVHPGGDGAWGYVFHFSLIIFSFDEPQPSLAGANRQQLISTSFMQQCVTGSARCLFAGWRRTVGWNEELFGQRISIKLHLC